MMFRIHNYDFSASTHKCIYFYKYTTNKNISEQMINISGEKIAVKYSKQKEGDIKNSWADIFLAKKFLNYNPKIEFEEGIKNLMNY